MFTKRYFKLWRQPRFAYWNLHNAMFRIVRKDPCSLGKAQPLFHNSASKHRFFASSVVHAWLTSKEFLRQFSKQDKHLALFFNSSVYFYLFEKSDIASCHSVCPPVALTRKPLSAEATSLVWGHPARPPAWALIAIHIQVLVLGDFPLSEGLSVIVTGLSG